MDGRCLWLWCSSIILCLRRFRHHARSKDPQGYLYLPPEQTSLSIIPRRYKMPYLRKPLVLIFTMPIRWFRYAAWKVNLRCREFQLHFTLKGGGFSVTESQKKKNTETFPIRRYGDYFSIIRGVEKVKWGKFSTLTLPVSLAVMPLPRNLAGL